MTIQSTTFRHALPIASAATLLASVLLSACSTQLTPTTAHIAEPSASARQRGLATHGRRSAPIRRTRVATAPRRWLARGGGHASAQKVRPRS